MSRLSHDSLLRVSICWCVFAVRRERVHLIGIARYAHQCKHSLAGICAFHDDEMTNEYVCTTDDSLQFSRISVWINNIFSLWQIRFDAAIPFDLWANFHLYTKPHQNIVIIKRPMIKPQNRQNPMICHNAHQRNI